MRRWAAGWADREEDCRAGSLGKSALRENLFWATLYLEPNFRSGVTFDAKNIFSCLGVLEHSKVGGDRERKEPRWV